jgi:molecular chaperone DnaK
MVDDNIELGRFDLIGIPPAPRGKPQIEVTFDIDTNGIVHVTAKDMGTGKEQSIKITAPTKLSSEDIEKMVNQAEKYAEADKKKKEEVELANQANTLVYSTENSLKAYGDKISNTDRGNIEQELNSLKNVIKGRDADKIKRGMGSLEKMAQNLAQEAYKATDPKQQGSSQEPSDFVDPADQEKKKNNKDDIIDADFTAVNSGFPNDVPK